MVQGEGTLIDLLCKMQTSDVDAMMTCIVTTATIPKRVATRAMDRQTKETPKTAGARLPNLYLKNIIALKH